MVRIFLLLALLSGCDLRETYEDVSSERCSKYIIGTRYEVVGSLDAYGSRRHSNAPVTRVLLIPPPGVEGRTIGFSVPVRRGSTVTVRKVVRTNRIFENEINLEVDLDGTPLPVNAPVTVELIRGNEGKDYLELNPEIFRKIPTT